MKFGTGERIEPQSNSNIFDWCVLQRHIFAYNLVGSLCEKNDIVLDYGCGEGYGAYHLSKYCKKVIAVDSNEETINEAKSKYSSNNCVFLTVEEFIINNYEFDKVISFQVIEHVENLSEYFTQLFSHLKSNGLIYITTPNAMFRLTPDQKPWNPYHLKEYSYEELLETISKYCNRYKISGISGGFYIKIIEKSRIAFLKKNVSKRFKIINKTLHYLSSFKSSFSNRIISYLKKKTQSNKYSTTANDLELAIDFLVVCSNQ